MADPIKDGDPAFPNVPDGGGDRWASWDMGMSLRDYFAAKAMRGEVAACQSQRANPEEVAKFAYDVADAMLRARENGNG